MNPEFLTLVYWTLYELTLPTSLTWYATLLICLSFSHTAFFFCPWITSGIFLIEDFILAIPPLEHSTCPPCLDLLFLMSSSRSQLRYYRLRKNFPGRQTLVVPLRNSFFVSLAHFIFLVAFTIYLCVCHFPFISRGCSSLFSINICTITIQ